MEERGTKRKHKEPNRWIRKLQQRQRSKVKSNSSQRLGPIDTIVIGDSILKYVDQIRHAAVISYPGISCTELEQLIKRNKIPEMEGKAVIMIHAGTNNLDEHWRSTVFKITQLLVTTTDKFPHAKVVWSTILPRPAPTERYNKHEVRANIIKINKEMKRRQRHLRIITCPSHTSFHQAKYPVYKLFARDYLHLKPKGTILLRELYRQHLLRLRSLWGMEIWEVKDLPDPETKIDRNWLTTLCNNNINRNH